MGRPVGCTAKKWLDMDGPLSVCRPKRMKKDHFLVRLGRRVGVALTLGEDSFLDTPYLYFIHA